MIYSATIITDGSSGNMRKNVSGSGCKSRGTWSWTQDSTTSFKPQAKILKKIVLIYIKI